jgi:hypothetical protein
MKIFRLFFSFLYVTVIVAVNLNQYTRPNCHGAKRTCTNINPRACCQARARVFSSGDCTGCTSTDFHFLWRRSGSYFCGINISGINGNRCISGSNLRGHSWCRLCGTLTTADVAIPNVQEAQCTSFVEPNIATKDDVTWYRIDEGVPEADREALNEWLDGNGTADVLAEHLQQYKVAFSFNSTAKTEE